MFLQTNLKWLRKLKKRTQDDVAFALDLKRSTYSGYENGVGEPNLTRLVALAGYFKVSLDNLIAIDLRKVPVSQLYKLDTQERIMTLVKQETGKALNLTTGE